MIYNAILLYSKVGAFSRHHQRGFLWQQIGVNAETHNQALCRERVYIGGFHQVPHVGAQGIPREERAERL